MKIKNIYKVLGLFMTFILVNGCEDLGELNVDPDRPAAVPADFLLTSAQKDLADNFGDEWASGRFSLLYAQYWAQNDYTTESRYQLRPGVNNNYWTSYYAGGLADLESSITISRKIATDEATNQIQVARIMKAWVFHNLVDMYGDVPYSEALKGASVVTPKFDNQKDIYIDLLKELSEASDSLVTTAALKGDVIYNNKPAMWKKFANSLRLRLAMRMSDVDDMQSLVKTTITDAIADGVFTSNADDALFKYLSSPPNNNPLNQARKTRADAGVSNVLIDKMLASGDPRISAYVEKATNFDKYVGMAYGLGDEAITIKTGAVSQPSGAAKLASGVLASTAPYIMMTYSEVQFIMAEAVQRGYMTGTASAYYDKAVLANMKYWEVSDADAATYLSANPYDASDYTTSIGVEKWVAMYMQGHQGWAEWRRLDFGILRAPAGGYKVGTTIPVRITYPTNEQTLNGINFDAAVVSIGGTDDLATKLFWDTKDNNVLDSSGE